MYRTYPIANKSTDSAMHGRDDDSCPPGRDRSPDGRWQCTRPAEHEMPHMAGVTDPTEKPHTLIVAEWDDDRSTDPDQLN